MLGQNDACWIERVGNGALIEGISPYALCQFERKPARVTYALYQFVVCPWATEGIIFVGGLNRHSSHSLAPLALAWAVAGLLPSLLLTCRRIHAFLPGTRATRTLLPQRAQAAAGQYP